MVLTEQEQRESLMRQRAYWYQRVFCIFELIKNLQGRETAFITNKGETENFLNVRYLYSASYDIFRKHIESLKFLDKNINVYRSVASVYGIPVSSYNLIRRKEEEEYKFFDKNFDSHVTEYDLLLDLDFKECSTPSEAYYQAKKVKDLLDSYKLPYGVWSTSLKGFHFWISGKYFQKENEDWLKKRLSLFQTLAYNIKGIYDVKCLDTSIFDSKRLSKAPYSFVGDGSVCLPLDDKQFQDFFIDAEKVSGFRHVINIVHIKDRGLMLRNQDLSEEELRQNCLKFVKDLS